MSRRIRGSISYVEGPVAVVGNVLLDNAPDSPIPGSCAAIPVIEATRSELRLLRLVEEHIAAAAGSEILAARLLQSAVGTAFAVKGIILVDDIVNAYPALPQEIRLNEQGRVHKRN